MREVYGLLGRGISYSRSPEIHSELWGEKVQGREYQLFDVEELSSFVTRAKALSGLRGFNVTIPYKEQIIPYLDRLEGDALAIQAVNTVKCLPSGLWIGYNTDVLGFEALLDEVISSTTDAEVYVLGTGGAAKSVVRAWEKRGKTPWLVSRTPWGAKEIGYVELSYLLTRHSHRVIINTTPLGSQQHVDSCPPIPYDQLTADDVLIDLVYSPAETLFIRQGRAQGACVINGWVMLVEQARAAQEIWTNDVYR